MSKLTLKTSLPMFEDLHKIADVRSKNVKVGRGVLLDLLMDHSAMAARLEELGERPHDDAGEAPPRVRKRGG